MKIAPALLLLFLGSLQANIRGLAGYLTPPVENPKPGAEVLEPLFAYIFGSYYNKWRDSHSFAQSCSDPPFKTLHSFQLYQDHAVLFYLA